MTAKDVVKAITSALNRSYGQLSLQLHNPTSSYVTAVLAPEGGAISIDRNMLAGLGVRYSKPAWHCRQIKRPHNRHIRRSIL